MNFKYELICIDFFPFQMRLTFICLTYAYWLVVLVSYSGASDEEMLTKRSIALEIADIAVSIKTLTKQKIVEAYNASTNVREPGDLRWVSLGLPRLLTSTDRLDSSKVVF